MFDRLAADKERDQAEKTVLRKMTEAFEAGFDKVLTYEPADGKINLTAFVSADDARIIPHCEVKGYGETPDDALADWHRNLKKQPQTGRVLFWRVRPEMEWARDFQRQKTRWMVYARFSVDEKEQSA